MHTTSNLIIAFDLRMHKWTCSASEVESVFLVVPNKWDNRHHVTKLLGSNLRFHFIIIYGASIIIQYFSDI